MFGRRRRTPLLGAAVIAGTATVAARHGARRQVEADTERQFQAQQAAEFRRIAEEREKERTQKAIDQAVSEALAKQQQQQQAEGNMRQADQQQSVAISRAAPAIYHPGDAPPVYTGVGAYPQDGQSPYLHPQSAGGVGHQRHNSTGNLEADVCFCSECGARGSVGHKFCAACGRPMATRAPERPEKQLM